MVLLFSGMQSSLSMVYDREMGVMKILLTTPLPRWYLLVSKLFAGTILSVIQAYCFLIICLPIIYLTTPFVTNISGGLLLFHVFYIFTYVRCSRFTSFCLYQAIRKLCRNYEFCNFSNVFYILSVVSLMETIR